MFKTNSHEELSETALAQLEKRLSASRMRLIAKAPFFGVLAMELDVIVDTSGRTPTASVSIDKKLRIGPEFVSKLTDKELDFLFCHEVLHPGLGLFDRMGTRDLKISNVAHDYVINLIAEDSGFQVIKDSLLDDRYRDLSFEEVYTLISDELDRRREDGDGDDGDGGSGGSGSDGDSGDDQDGDGNGGNGEDGDEDGGDDGDGGCSGGHGGIGKCNERHSSRGEQAAHDTVDKIMNGQEGDIDIDPNGDNLSQGEVDRLKREWKQTLAEARQKAESSKGWGNAPNMLKQMVDEILDPKLDWGEILSRWVGDKGNNADYSYRRLSRRSVSDIMMPSLNGGMAEVAILIDSSGSMSGSPIRDVVSEIGAIIEDFGLASMIIVCDAAVHDIIEDPADLEDVLDRLDGGGGSDFRPAFEALEDAQWTGPIIAATDGWIDVPDEEPYDCPVVWLIPEGCDIPTDWGEPIFIED